jgi:hypothetical protein
LRGNAPEQVFHGGNERELPGLIVTAVAQVAHLVHEEARGVGAAQALRLGKVDGGVHTIARAER